MNYTLADRLRDAAEARNAAKACIEAREARNAGITYDADANARRLSAPAGGAL